MSAAPAADAGMKRNLGLTSATTLIVGSAIGSGIFILPSLMADRVASPGLLMLAWIVAGAASLAGALTFAEMAGMFPRAGGTYVFLREAFNDGVAFLYGWTWFWVIGTGIIAAVAYAFALFVARLFPLTDFGVKLVAMSCIAFLTLVNYVGVKYGGLVQNVFTVLKVGAIAALVAAGFLFASEPQPLFDFAETGGAAAAGGFGTALLLAFFAYDGWSQSAVVASEVRNPQRTVPKAMLIGTLVVMAVYVAATAAYVHVLPFARVRTTSTLAADVMDAVAGPTGVLFITIAIVVSTFGTVNAFVLSCPRVVWAMAKDGLFYRGMGSLHRRFGTPDFALLIQAEWACLLVLTGTYERLVTYATLAIWGFYGIAGVGFFRLRRKAAHLERPYRVFGYPLVPALFVATSAFVVANTLYFDRDNALWSVGLVATGIPALFLLNRRRRATEGP